MISTQTLELARQTAEELRQRGEFDRARAIEALVDATNRDVMAPLNLVTSTEAGELLGVTGQTIKNWVREGHLDGIRLGGRILISRQSLAEYVRRAGHSLDLDRISDAEATDLVAEARQRPR